MSYFLQDPSYEAGQHFAKNFPNSLNHVDANEKPQTYGIETFAPRPDVILTNSETTIKPSMTEETGVQTPRDILLEVLEESNLRHYAKFVDKNERAELEMSPVSIRDYLTFKSKADVPEKKKNQKEEDKEAQRQQASRFMCGIMDECTHLSNFSIPVSHCHNYLNVVQ